jgi:hypothetical protein
MAPPSSNHEFLFPPPCFELVSHGFGAYEAFALDDGKRWVKLKGVGVDPQSYLNSNILLHVTFETLSTTKYGGFASASRVRG